MVSAPTILIKEVRIGNHTIRNVEAFVMDNLLLPFPLVNSIGPFTIDTRAGELVWHTTPVEKPESCSVTPIRYRYRNETVQSSLKAKAGERCVLTRKPAPGSSIGALKIIVQPRNGNVQSLEGYSVAYTPKSGFKGNDQFIQRVCEDSNLEGTRCTNIEYVVTVY